MKHVKKFASLLLALIMALSVSITVLGVGETGSITINNAVKGQTYTIYKILELESYDVNKGAYSYKAASGWNDFINGQNMENKYVKVDDQGYVSWIEGASAADFAKAAQKYAAENNLVNQGSVTANDTSVVFDDLELGYYLLDSSLGTLCSLETTNPDVTIEEKNGAPTNEKTVEEDSSGDYGSKNDADIGQTVNYKSTITAQAGAQNYVFHDKMDAGLTYTKVNKITLNGNAVEDSNYNVIAPAADGDTFDIEFTQAFCDTLKPNDKIVISYSATVNENAVVAEEGNKNESKVEYGEQGKTTTTPPSETKTYTWDVDVFKYAKDGNTEKPLAGAKFKLSKQHSNDPIALVAEGDNCYRVATDDDTDTVTEIITDDSGKFTIKGLDADTYYLTETMAPAGYNKLADPITVIIGENGVVNATPEEPQGVDEVKILNQSGAELPSTGGIGTTIFYVIGSILLIGAAILLVTKKRMNVHK